MCQVLIVSGSCFRLLLESEHFTDLDGIYYFLVFSVVGKAENPLLYGNIIGMTGAAVIMILLSVQKYRKQGSYRIWNIDKTQDKRRLKRKYYSLVC